MADLTASALSVALKTVYDALETGKLKPGTRDWVQFNGLVSNLWRKHPELLKQIKL